MSVLSVRIDSELEEKLRYLMQKRNIVDKSAYIRQLIQKSLFTDLLDFLCDEVKFQRMSAWKAAEIAKISLLEILKELSQRNISSYDEAALKEDLEFAKRE
jgi:predicted HTH domain antitoxin